MRLKIEAGCGILEILKARCGMLFRQQDSGWDGYTCRLDHNLAKVTHHLNSNKH